MSRWRRRFHQSTKRAPSRGGGQAPSVELAQFVHSPPQAMPTALHHARSTVMTRTLNILGLALAIASASAIAQTPQTRPTDQQKPMSSDIRTVTVTGCVKTWTGSTASSGGTTRPNPETGKPAETPSGAQYVLSDITTSTSETAKPSPSAADPATATSYLLMAKDSSVNLSQHLNHKVTVSGTVSGSQSGEMDKSMPSTSSTAERGSQTAMSHQPATLMVTTLTMVSA